MPKLAPATFRSDSGTERGGPVLRSAPYRSQSSTVPWPIHLWQAAGSSGSKPDRLNRAVALLLVPRTPN